MKTLVICFGGFDGVTTLTFGAMPSPKRSAPDV